MVGWGGGLKTVHCCVCLKVSKMWLHINLPHYSIDKFLEMNEIINSYFCLINRYKVAFVVIFHYVSLLLDKTYFVHI